MYNYNMNVFQTIQTANHITALNSLQGEIGVMAKTKQQALSFRLHSKVSEKYHFPKSNLKFWNENYNKNHTEFSEVYRVRGGWSYAES